MNIINENTNSYNLSNFNSNNINPFMAKIKTKNLFESTEKKTIDKGNIFM